MPAVLPAVQLTRFPDDAFSLYRALRRANMPSVLLESARVSGRMGRYSILAVRPYDVLSFSVGDPRDPFQTIRERLAECPQKQLSGLPPFLGGAIGFFSYECKSRVEPTLRTMKEPILGVPQAYFLLVSEGVVLDHEKRTALVFAENGRRAAKLARACENAKTAKGFAARTLSKGPVAVQSSQTRAEFAAMVRLAKRRIREGEIFQANLSQSFSFKAPSDPLGAYAALKKVNPSPFFGYLDAKKFQILSGSPERLVKMERGEIQTRPIAGTRPRGVGADAKISLELLLSEKERAEHIMLVDLERNDMGRVAEYGSVAVDELMAIEDYSHVKHIVSNVRGRLRAGLDGLDVLRAFFPGGTITGAPKVRCMQIIDALESAARGPYTGSLGYFSFSGNLDFNILIRSLVVAGGRAHLQVGAGIVADSKPDKEYDETLYKAEGVLAALYGPDGASRFLAERGVARRLSRRAVAI